MSNNFNQFTKLDHDEINGYKKHDCLKYVQKIVLCNM